MTQRYYEPVHDLAVITCFFNPAGYQSRVSNFEKFSHLVTGSSIFLLTIEAAFGETPFCLNSFDNVITVRGAHSHILWQKERLLNLALAHVPDKYTKIAWVDGDIIFENPAWARETSALLDKFMVVQPFERLVRLSRGLVYDDGKSETKPSFAYLYAMNDISSKIGRFHHHGHTGIAWAARRELLDKCRLYDVLVSGSSDHFMAHAFSSTLDSPCFEGIRSSLLFDHFSTWAKRVEQICNGSLSYVSGNALHLWHGSKESRRYQTILKELMNFNFDPEVDLFHDEENGLLRWSAANPALSNWGTQYFWDRKEDQD